MKKLINFIKSLFKDKKGSAKVEIKYDDELFNRLMKISKCESVKF